MLKLAVWEGSRGYVCMFRDDKRGVLHITPHQAYNLALKIETLRRNEAVMVFPFLGHAPGYNAKVINGAASQLLETVEAVLGRQYEVK